MQVSICYNTVIVSTTRTVTITYDANSSAAFLFHQAACLFHRSGLLLALSPCHSTASASCASWLSNLSPAAVHDIEASIVCGAGKVHKPTYSAFTSGGFDWLEFVYEELVAATFGQGVFVRLKVASAWAHELLVLAPG